MHVKAPYPHALPYQVLDERGHPINNVIEADDETGEYAVTYFQKDNILTDAQGNVMVTHKRALKLTIKPIPGHAYYLEADELPFIRVFDVLVTSIQDQAGEFETLTLSRAQLVRRMLDVLDAVLGACAGHSPAGPGFVWLPVVDRKEDGTPLAIPPSDWNLKDVSATWEKYHRLRVPAPLYIETERPPLGYHPENE